MTSTSTAPERIWPSDSASAGGLRQQGVAQRVAEEERAVLEALGLGEDHVVLALDVTIMPRMPSAQKPIEARRIDSAGSIECRSTSRAKSTFQSGKVPGV